MDARLSDFGEILESALTLPAGEQVRLCLVLQRVTGLSQEPRALVALETPPAPAGPSCEEWLLSIQQEPGWNQLQLLDDALAQAESEDDTRALALARERLLQGQPALAVRNVVVDLAMRHPIGVLLGCAGLVLAVIGLGRVAFRAVF